MLTPQSGFLTLCERILNVAVIKNIVSINEL